MAESGPTNQTDGSGLCADVIASSPGISTCQALSTDTGYLLEVYLQNSRHTQCSSFLLLPAENAWNPAARSFLYLIGMLTCFLGLAAIMGTFMEALDVIVTTKVEVQRRNPRTGLPEKVVERFWNRTIANIALLAVGTSAPEVLVALMDAVKNIDNTPGVLGIGTIIGSAAFNLLIITAVCCITPAKGQIKRIENYSVFVVEFLASVWAHVWLFIIMEVSSPSRIVLWEAILTLLQFPLFIFVAYGQDQNWALPIFGKKRKEPLSRHGSRQALILPSELASSAAVDKFQSNFGSSAAAEGSVMTPSGAASGEDSGVWSGEEEKGGASSDDGGQIVVQGQQQRREEGQQLEGDGKNLSERRAGSKEDEIGEEILEEEVGGSGGSGGGGGRGDGKYARGRSGRGRIEEAQVGREHIGRASTWKRRRNQASASSGGLQPPTASLFGMMGESVWYRAHAFDVRGGSITDLALLTGEEGEEEEERMGGKAGKERSGEGSKSDGSEGETSAEEESTRFSARRLERERDVGGMKREREEAQDEELRWRMTSSSGDWEVHADVSGVSKRLSRGSANGGSAADQLSAEWQVRDLSPSLTLSCFTKRPSSLVPSPPSIEDSRELEYVGCLSLPLTSILSQFSPSLSLPLQSSSLPAAASLASIADSEPSILAVSDPSSRAFLEFSAEIAPIAAGQWLLKLTVADLLLIRSLDASSHPSSSLTLTGPSREGQQAASVSGQARGLFRETRDGRVSTGEWWRGMSRKWKLQFVRALSVGGGRAQIPTAFDLLLHFLTFYWKLLFAFIPPPSLLRGWPAFISCLLCISGIAVFIGEFASLFSCASGMDLSMTAMTFVAVGTSIPDLLASKMTTELSLTADSAIANINSSNTINIFLGVGLPSLIVSAYGRATHGKQMLLEQAATWEIALIIMFVIFLLYATILGVRRKLQGGELGGSRLWSYATFVGLSFMWIVFLVFSGLFASDKLRFN